MPCPICASNNSVLAYADTLKGRQPAFNYNFTRDHFLTYRMDKCLKCQHLFCPAIPQRISDKYEDVVDKDYLKHQMQRLESARKVIARILKYQKNGNLLDIGCATGDFLSVAKDYYAVEGLEISRWSAQIAAQRGFTVYRHPLSESNIAKTFDIITLWGVIEHFPDPKEELGRIAKLCAKNGIISVWTGNSASLTAKLLKKKWWYIQGQHIQLFSAKSLKGLFYSQGFESIYLGIYPYVTTLDSLVSSLGRYPKIHAPVVSLIKNLSFLKGLKIPLKVPGEVLAIFRRIR